MKQIPLTQGQFAMVDDDDYEILSKHKWYFTKQGYASRRDKTLPNRALVMMHRVIIGVTGKTEVDHIDKNGLNNQRNNLRPCTKSQNQGNRKMDKRNKSGYKGVFVMPDGRFRAEIRHNDKGIYIGIFDDAKEGGMAYDIKAIEIFGEFASLNFPINKHETPPK